MAAEAPVDEARQPLWFLLLLALAAAGGAVAYVPFLTVLLPVRIVHLSGNADVAALSIITFGGAIVASLANIAFGWLSDRSGGRRGWIVIGLVLSSAMLLLVQSVASVPQLIVVVMAWQAGLNMMLGPLAAWAGDCVPDGQKGLLGGLFSFAPALGALSGALVTFPGLIDRDGRLVMVVLLVTAMVLPAVSLGRDRRLPHLIRPVEPAPDAAGLHRVWRSVIGRMWIARLLVQVSEAALFAFLLFWLRSLEPDFSDSSAARLFSGVTCAAVPIALAVGRWSDRAGRPMLPLATMAGLAAIGLAVMASATTLEGALVGYALFGVCSMIFLALHSSQTLRVLPRPQHRGRDLGLFNLTNTVPSLIIPWLALALVPLFGFGALFMVLAVLSATACLLIAAIARPA